MGVLERIRGNGKSDSRDQLVDSLKEAVDQRDDSLGLLVEKIAELELALEDEGWLRLGLEGETEFSRSGLGKIIKLARLMYLKNPLIRRAVNVQCYYVFGQGVNIRGRHETVNEVVQRFLDNRRNQAVLTRPTAWSDKERDLQNEGNLFFSLFVNKATGRVQVRFLPIEQVVDIITNPDDRDEPWFYKRQWVERRFDLERGSWTERERTVYYPDWQFHDDIPARIGKADVEADVPVMHVKVGGLSGMRFGVPDTYAALDWARAYKTYLENWASLARALARFAWKLTGSKAQLEAAGKKFGTTVGADGGEINPPPSAASIAKVPQGGDLTPIPKTGAQVAADDGLQLRKMVGSGTDIPDTILGADPDMGNLATAKTLDRPTELAMRGRQTLWQGTIQDLCSFVVEWAVRAPRGPLQGTIETDEDDQQYVNLGRDNDGQEVDPTVDVDFPPILEQDISERIEAIVRAATLDGKAPANTIPPQVLARMLLGALGEENVDEIIDELDRLFPEAEEEPEEPEPQPAAEALMVEAVRELRSELVKLGAGRGADAS